MESTTGGVSHFQRNIDGPTATNIAEQLALLQARSHSRRPVKICVVVDAEDNEWLELVKVRLRLSKSEIVRRAVKALRNGQLVQSELRGRQD
jgi:hypothetical protein